MQGKQYARSAKTVRWGILGTGNIVHKTGPAIQRSRNGDWLGIAGRMFQNSERMASTYQVPRAYENYQALLDDPDIDAVYIALLNHMHLEWTLKAIQAGKAVLLEKPFTMNANEAEQIDNASQQANIGVMEAHVWRFHPAHQQVKEWVESGRIGDIGWFKGDFSIVMKPESTRWNKAWGGGCLYDVGCYPLAWSRYIIGEEPRSVEAFLATDQEHGVDRRFAATLAYPDDKIAQITAAFDLQSGGSSYEIIGTAGKIKVKFAGTSEQMVIQVDCNGQKQQWQTDRIEPYQYQVEVFADCILNSKALPYDTVDAVKQMRVLDALFASAEQQNKIHL